ncbi:MAG: DEAD/DEAH box helicase [Planctomycetes bacterium]|nr:DEAD/DEAH box helicase [Planctomycetota bacterium]
MSPEPESSLNFTDLGLRPELLEALAKVGYETPSPIQARTIPLMLTGRDLVGQAQTGTGKTAAFALPILQRITSEAKEPRALVLVPTRELAIQVAEAIHRYAAGMKGFRVLPVYGGQSYEVQLRALRRGVHVIVGTPGRIMDHLRRTTLKLDQIETIVLDEADEMLRMGFIEDVEWILDHCPDQRQIALFSATMPREIQRIAKKYLRNPDQVAIEQHLAPGSSIRQRVWNVAGLHKLDALTRFLEVEPIEAVIVFVRTKTSTVELAERLEARGFACEALNGDVPQSQRERTVDRLRKGRLDILIATDVAARGLDVERVSHVVNFDIPNDAEAYVHRIGRTGRAGRHGDAILFVSNRERNLLRNIERAIDSRLEPMRMPSVTDVNDRRVQRFKTRVKEVLETEETEVFERLVTELCQEEELPMEKVAAALAKIAQGDTPLLLDDIPEPRRKKERRQNDDDAPDFGGAEIGTVGPDHHTASGMVAYRVAAGRQHGIRAGDLVGAITGETGITNARIGRIVLHADFSTIELPDGLPHRFFRKLEKVRVKRRFLRLAPVEASPPPHKFKKKSKQAD